MIKRKRIAPSEREKKLIEKIDKAKKALNMLRQKRKEKIGKLACQCGLDVFDDNQLKKAFEKLVKELKKEVS